MTSTIDLHGCVFGVAGAVGKLIGALGSALALSVAVNACDTLGRACVPDDNCKVLSARLNPDAAVADLDDDPPADDPSGPSEDGGISVASRGAAGSSTAPDLDPGFGGTGDSPSDAGIVDPNPSLDSIGIPCALRVVERRIVASHAGCALLSGSLEASVLEWDGSALQLFDQLSELADGQLERTRICPTLVIDETDPAAPPRELRWRFNESWDFAALLAPGECPTGPIDVRYHYEECPFRGPGLVCASGDLEACTFDGEITLIAEPLPIDAGVALPPEIETDCQTVGVPPITHPAAAGEACGETRECAAGHFCNRLLEDGSCSPLGERSGVCELAPRFAECNDVAEPVCRCGGLAFPPTLPDGSNTNRCKIEAIGETPLSCE